MLTYGLPKGDVSPAAQHAKANQLKEGTDMNKLQTGPGGKGPVKTSDV